MDRLEHVDRRILAAKRLFDQRPHARRRCRKIYQQRVGHRTGDRQPAVLGPVQVHFEGPLLDQPTGCLLNLVKGQFRVLQEQAAGQLAPGGFDLRQKSCV